ncbi:GIY-YIG nuclease family protein [Tepidibacillus fermentans]|uniref:Putative endonuclease n=1 Tax=Tepidibacillus fermentans TaxID=1281767 RepID=A0A4R3K5B4_9BACI|nr:GIY-YIG nuclease family protein [Tepidibacillus fermentans]TCS77959.1 putative endonuclease [Tepidibacillus fermentans]
MVISVDEPYYVYILECKDHTYYTGSTNCIEHRLKQHQLGKAAKYTRGRGPVKLVYVEKGQGKSWGLKRENEIKRLPRKKKEQLILEGGNIEYPKKL